MWERDHADLQIPWTSFFADMQNQVLGDAVDPDKVMQEAELLFPYAWGTPVMHQAFVAGGTDAVRAQFASLPRGTGDLMGTIAPAQAIDELPDLTGAVPAGYTLDDDTRLGALDVTGYRARAGLAPLPWTGDRLQVFAGADPASTVVLWRQRYSYTRAAELPRLPGAVRVRADGNEVDVLVAETEAELAPFAAALGW
jgi:hypothetical protein